VRSIRRRCIICAEDVVGWMVEWFGTGSSGVMRSAFSHAVPGDLENE
jgi:hypothetical protein